MSEVMQTDLYTINVGPQHPSAHGGLRIETVLDGEIVHDLTVHLGFVHRSIEKIAESRTYQQFVPFNSRLDYLSSNLPTMAYCQAVEKLCGIEVPERAEYIRVITGELNRIASHLLFAGSLAIDLGATTGFIYCMRDREFIMDMMEMISGQRMIAAYNRIGGVSDDLPVEFFPAIENFLAYVPKFLKEYDGLLTGNEIFQARLKGVGKMTLEQAIAYGTTGPNLRACGLDYDLRRADPYGIYDRFTFEIPTATGGDAWARYLLRLREIEQSAVIIRQALDGLPAGEFRGKAPRVLKPEAGASVYHRIEGAKGELGYFIVSDGTDKPYRLHVRAPSFIHLMLLPIITPGEKFQDLITNIATLDPVLGEADR
jgi:NADH-quinone oxidoreductase subunit D